MKMRLTRRTAAAGYGAGSEPVSWRRQGQRSWQSSAAEEGSTNDSKPDASAAEQEGMIQFDCEDEINKLGFHFVNYENNSFSLLTSIISPISADCSIPPLNCARPLGGWLFI